MDLNFEAKILDGSATLTVDKVQSGADQVVLDSRGLDIKGVYDQASGQTLDFKIHPEDYVGSKLEVQLPITNAKK